MQDTTHIVNFHEAFHNNSYTILVHATFITTAIQFQYLQLSTSQRHAIGKAISTHTGTTITYAECIFVRKQCMYLLFNIAPQTRDFNKY